MNAQDSAAMAREEMDLPERFVGGERSGDAEVGDVVVDRDVVGDGDDVVVDDYIRGWAPVFSTVGISDLHGPG